MKKTNLLFLFLIATLFSCSYSSVDDLTEEIVIDNPVNYQDNIKSIIDNNCIMCHNSPPVNGAPNALTTYTTVKEGIENRGLIGRISTNDLGSVMPLGGPRLPQNLIDLIVQWEQEGFLEN